MWRSDAIATLYFFGPLRSLISSGRPGIPILMYHSVADGVADSRHPYFQTVTSRAVFERHMKLLQEHGFSTVTLAEAVARQKSGTTGSRKPVVITFDDGYRDFLTNAFPILERYGFGATVFLPTAYIGDSARDFKGLDCLTWGEVRDLHRAGVEFGSHTVTHPQLRDLAWPAVESEVRSSKAAIEDGLGCRIGSFSYPYAFPETDRRFRDRFRDLLEDSGYENGVTTVIGTAYGDDKYLLKRLPVNSADGDRLFEAKLGGGYDWLRPVQYAAKILKNKRVAF